MEKSPSVKLKEVAADETSGQATFDMANLRPERTGLPFCRVHFAKGDARHDGIKLARAAKVRPSEMITIAVRPTPRVIRGKMNFHEFDLVSPWIELNRGVLIDYWNGDIEYTEDALRAIKPIA
jgi:hypothetical protein